MLRNNNAHKIIGLRSNSLYFVFTVLADPIIFCDHTENEPDYQQGKPNWPEQKQQYQARNQKKTRTSSIEGYSSSGHFSAAQWTLGFIVRASPGLSDSQISLAMLAKNRLRFYLFGAVWTFFC
jgi:hypothetical protein